MTKGTGAAAAAGSRARNRGLARMSAFPRNRSPMMELNTVMTANPACCGRETSLQEVARLMAEIGRASCRERVCQYASLSVVAGSLKKKITKRYRHNTNK